MANLSGRRILVVHDEPLAALMLERLLRQLGCSVPGRTARAADAIAIIETDRLGLDAAAVQVTDEGSVEVAATLERRGIPFLITAGHPSRALSDQFKDRPMLVSPFLLEDLKRALGALDMRPRHSTR
jgi:CheY-like chemotaxis protein